MDLNTAEELAWGTQVTHPDYGPGIWYGLGQRVNGSYFGSVLFDRKDRPVDVSVELVEVR